MMTRLITYVLILCCLGCTACDRDTPYTSPPPDEKECLSYDCMGDCNGLAEYDTCGVCNGQNDCSCPDNSAGTTKDCSGECGGIAIIDDCNVCAGDNSTCTGCMDSTAINYHSIFTIACDECCEYELDIDTPGCTNTHAENFVVEANIDDGSCIFEGNLVWIESLQNDTLIIYLVNEYEIGGFQFDITSTVEGFEVLDVFNGSAATAGFSLSSGSSGTIIAFSFSGDTIPAGDGILCYVTVSYSGLEGYINIDDAVFSDNTGGSVDVAVGNPINLESHFKSELNLTGVSQLVILSNSISTLDVRDEIGIYDGSGVVNHNDCSNNVGELLVGSTVWENSQTTIVAIGSVDVCALGGVQLSGFIEGNDILVKVWDSSTEIEYIATPVYSSGEGKFGEALTVISELNY